MTKFQPLTKSKPKKEKKVKDTSNIITRKDLELSLKININPNYEGYRGTIAELLYSMPKEVKSIFANSTIKSIYCGTGIINVKLLEGIDIRIKEVKFARRHKKHIKITHNNTLVLDKLI